MKKLSDQQLESALSFHIRKEKESFLEIINHLLEVDRRKLHAEKHKNLAHYLIEKFEISETAAYQRISAMRMIQELPEAYTSLKENKLYMSQLAGFNKAIKQKQSETKEKVSLETKLELLKEIQGKSHKETNRILAEKLKIKPKKKEVHNQQADGTERTEFTQSQELQEKLKKCMELASHTLQQNHQELNFTNLLDHLAEEYIKAHTPKPSVSQAATLTKKRRQQIIQRDGCCQFHINENEICGSQHMLQCDHIIPKYAGGKDDDNNLQAICAMHNKYRYERECRA